MYEEVKKVATQSSQPVSGMQAFKTGLLMAIPRDRYTFGALLKTVLFYGGGWAALMGLWMVYGPRGEDGSVHLSFDVAGAKISVTVLLACVVAAFPFIGFYSVRRVLEGRANTPYFETLGAPIFLRALLLGGLILPMFMVSELIKAYGSWWSGYVGTATYFVFAVYLQLVIVHLVASRELSWKPAWRVLRKSFFTTMMSSNCAVVVLALLLCVVYIVLLAMVVGGTTMLSFKLGTDPAILLQEWTNVWQGDPLYRGLLPYDFVFCGSMGLLIALFAWACVGSYAALTTLYCAHKSCA